MKQNNLHSLMDKLKQQSCKVVEVTKDHYVLENGNVFEHTFSIDDDITVEQFQHLLDKAKDMVLQTLEKIDDNI